MTINILGIPKTSHNVVILLIIWGGVPKYNRSHIGIMLQLGIIRKYSLPLPLPVIVIVIVGSKLNGADLRITS